MAGLGKSAFFIREVHLAMEMHRATLGKESHLGIEKTLLPYLGKGGYQTHGITAREILKGLKMGSCQRLAILIPETRPFRQQKQIAAASRKLLFQHGEKTLEVSSLAPLLRRDHQGAHTYF